MGLTVPSYFYGRWGWNLGGQTTIRRCGANAMQPPPPRISWGVRGERCMCDLARTHWCIQAEVFLEVATLYLDASRGCARWWCDCLPHLDGG
jgi:hypothetical protein